MKIIRLTDDQIDAIVAAMTYVRGEENISDQAIYTVIKHVESILREAAIWEKVFAGELYADATPHGVAVLDKENADNLRAIYMKVSSKDEIVPIKDFSNTDPTKFQA